MPVRPEHQAPPDIFYNEEEAKKYTSNSRIITIQSEMSERAIELLNLKEDDSCFILDIGCGSGLSGDMLTHMGHYWVGVDISESMLNVAIDREVDGDVVLSDAGQGMFFRPGVFDGAISISAIQWLCNADVNWHSPVKRLNRFFSTLFGSLRRGARAVFQFYPDNPDQITMITSSAMKAGFTGGLVIDFPNSTKAKKYYLCLFTGASSEYQVPKALGTGEDQVSYAGERSRQNNKKRKNAKDRNWVLKKKQTARNRGLEGIPTDTKYTARKRRPRF